MRHFYCNKLGSAALLLCLALTGCSRSNTIQSISEEELFTLSYGNFEEELSISDLNGVGDVRMGIAMRDGFFYIVDGNSKKIMELNSYGDLISLFYNEDSQTSTLLKKSGAQELSVHRELSYPFDYPGMIAVDSNKCIYAACTIPRNRQEQGEGGIRYSQAVLRFARDGSSVDYIGQQGPSGTPFPFIKNLYITEKDELVVVCASMEGILVYWFASDGFLKYMIPINSQELPSIYDAEGTLKGYQTLDNVVPDLNSYRLYLKVDYYSTFVDEDSKVQAGINYDRTLLYTLDCETGVFENSISIPPYEESVVVDYSRLTYRIPYDFLGVTKNGWKFFIIKTEDGFNIEMIQNENMRILRRHFVMDHDENLFYNMSLSSSGIISAMYVDKSDARIVWYRTDNLIDAILNN